MSESIAHAVCGCSDLAMRSQVRACANLTLDEIPVI